MMKKVFFAVFTAIAIAALSLFVACGDKQGGGASLLSAPSITLDGATVSWSKVDGADGYSVRVGQNSYETQNTRYTVAVNALGSYEIAVKAYRLNGGKKEFSAESNKLTYTLNATKLAAPVISKSGNAVTWTAVANADKYRVYVNEVAKAEVSVTTWTFAETVAGAYTVTVKAVSDSALFASSDDSNALAFTVGQAITDTAIVTDEPYNAKADGVSNDRAAIQKAVDDMYKNGGGTVVLTAGKTFLTSNIIMRDNVTLKFEDGATLKQSADEYAYVRYENGEYTQFEPAFGMDLAGDIEWNHAWTHNYPLILGPEGVKNIKITGNGVITMASHDVCYDTMHIAPIGLFNADGFEVSDITIDGYQSYAMMVTSSFNGLIKNVTVKNPRCSCNDGINMQNNQNIRVTGCDVRSGDDALYVGAYYDDPRGSGDTWWNNNRTHVANKNIEFDNNTAVAGPNCKGFSFHFGGYMLDNPEDGEISEIYVHDNHFNTFGVWNHSPDPHAAYKPNMTLKPYQPFKTVRWENNEVDHNMGMGIPCSDMYDDSGTFKSMQSVINGNFDYAKLGYWVAKPNADKTSVGYKSEGNNNYGFIDKLDKGDAKLYQGLWLEGGKGYEFSAKLKSDSDGNCRIFVRDLLTQELIAAREFACADWTTVKMEFTAPASANYHIGIERGGATGGHAYIDDAQIVAASSRHTVFTTQTPEKSASDAAFDLGTAFSVTSSGTVTGVRMYVCENESGAHAVRVWNNDTGAVVAGPYGWNVARGAARWETFSLPATVRIKSGGNYTVSVTNGADKIYAVTENGFDGVTSHSPFITVTENSGVKSANIGELPTADGNKSCFFRDIIFVPDEQSIFGGATPDDIDGLNGGELDGELGIVFSADVDGYITKVKMLGRAGLTGRSEVRIWEQDGAKLVAGPYAWTHTGGASGWKEFTLPAPFAVNKGVKYVMSVTQPSGTWYCSEPNVFAAPMTCGNLHTYSGSGVSSDRIGEMPTNVWSNQSFFRDVVFVAAECADSLTENYIAQLKTLYGDGVIDDGNAEELEKLCNIITGMLEKLPPETLDGIPQEDRELAEKVKAEVERFKIRAEVVQTLLGETSAAPENYSYTEGGGMEFGVIFSADVDGYVTKVKMYAHAELNITATVRIWKTDGEQLVCGPYDWKISGGVAGWKTFVLPAPFEVKANEKYTVSVGQPSGLFGSTFHVFAAERTARNLRTYIGSGVSSSALGVMPKNVYENQSFFRDVVFTPKTSTDNLTAMYVAELKEVYGDGTIDRDNADALRNLSALLAEMFKIANDPNAVSQADKEFVTSVINAVRNFDEGDKIDQTIFGDNAAAYNPTGSESFEGELGTVFSADVDGYVTKVRFLSGAGLVDLNSSSTVKFWKVDGAQLLATYQWTHTDNSEGWKEFTLPAPLHIEANVKYIVSVTQQGWYKKQEGMHGADSASGNLHTYVGSGVSGNLGEMPTNVFANQTFFRDVTFTPTDCLSSLAEKYIAELKTVFGAGEVTTANAQRLRNLSLSVSDILDMLLDSAVIPQADKDFVKSVIDAVNAYYGDAK